MTGILERESWKDPADDRGRDETDTLTSQRAKDGLLLRVAGAAFFSAESQSRYEFTISYVTIPEVTDSTEIFFCSAVYLRNWFRVVL